MNCPNCGNPINGLHCSKCSFDLEQGKLYYVGDSARTQIPKLSRYIWEEKQRTAPAPEPEIDETIESGIIETTETVEPPASEGRKSSVFPNMVMISGFLSALGVRLRSKPSKRRTDVVITSNMVSGRRRHAKRVSIALKITCLLVLLADIVLALLLWSGTDIYQYVPVYSISFIGIFISSFVISVVFIDLIYTETWHWQEIDGELNAGFCRLSELISWLLYIIWLIIPLAFQICGITGWTSGQAFFSQVAIYHTPIFFVYVVFANPMIGYLECSRIHKKYNYSNLHYVLWWIISMGLCILFVMLTLPGPSSHIKTLLSALPHPDGSGTSAVQESEEVMPSVTLEAGDVITLGRYEQDGDLENGAEELSWLVLSVSDGQALVICQMCVDVRPYREDGSGNLWMNSTIRGWLNQDFVNSVFSAGEQSVIYETQLTTKPAYVDENKFVHRYEDSDAEITVDRIFLPEMNDDRTWAKEPKISEYAKDKLSSLCPYDEDDQRTTQWLESHTAFWIRNPLDDGHNLAWSYNIEEARGVYRRGVPDSEVLVCPSMYIGIDAYLKLAEETSDPGGSTAED